MNKIKAEKFSHDWIEAWNKHDLTKIISHYADNIEFHSPFITLLKFNEIGVISDKKELKKYFEIGLNAYPDLYFKFHDVYIGVDSLVIHYTSVNGRKAAEVFKLNEQGKAVEVYCNYAEIG